MCKHTAVNEIEAELKKHPGVIASVDTESGKVSALFMLPKPYWETTNDTGGTGSLTAAEKDALVSEHDALVKQLPTLRKAERSKATTRINVIEGLLRTARETEESTRVNREREAERPVQRYGQPVNAAPTTNKLTWASLRAELDAKAQQAQRALLTSTVCCSGAYLCSKCKAKAGV